MTATIVAGPEREGHQRIPLVRVGLVGAAELNLRPLPYQLSRSPSYRPAVSCSVHAPRVHDRDRAKRPLAAAGAHFMSFFGRIATENISRWRGSELPLPPYLRR